jgi:hypothetical protein
MEKERKPMNFVSLLDEVAYSWSPGPSLFAHNILRIDKETFCINKLYITPERAHYKTDSWELAPGVFAQFVDFYNLTKKIMK